MASELKSGTFISTFPLEIRLKIYRYALVQPEIAALEIPKYWPVRQQPLSDDNPAWVSLTPALLRTNKQIYQGALLNLYGENTIQFNVGKDSIKWLDKIGPTNISLLRSIEICPFSHQMKEDYTTWQERDSPAAWSGLLNRLGNQGLKRVKVHLLGLKQGVQPWAAIKEMEKQVDFVRALGKLKGAQMELSGHFGKHWPSCLEQEIGISVGKPEVQNDEQAPSLLISLLFHQRDTENLAMMMYQVLIWRCLLMLCRDEDRMVDSR